MTILARAAAPLPVATFAICAAWAETLLTPAVGQRGIGRRIVAGWPLRVAWRRVILRLQPDHPEARVAVDLALTALAGGGVWIVPKGGSGSLPFTPLAPLTGRTNMYCART